jgi:hypothetical protein
MRIWTIALCLGLMLAICAVAQAADQALPVPGKPFATESITVSTSAIGTTATLCRIGGIQQRALIEVRGGSIFATLHDATATPSTSNALDLAIGTLLILDRPDLLRMIQNSGAAQVIVICLTTSPG